MRRNRIAWCLPIIAAVVLIPARAKADSYSFSISGKNIIASGTITAVPANGKYEATNIQGTIDVAGKSSQMNLLPVNSFDQNDNLLRVSGTPYLDSGGISFVANGVNYNLFFLSPSVGYVLNIGPGSFNSVGHQVSFYVGTNDSVETPEPPLILLLATGFAGLIFVFRRKLQLNGG